jgi:toxin CcdB
MAQFDLYRNPRRGMFPILLDVQSDLLSQLATRVVVPLMTTKRYGARPITRLNPTVTLGKSEYVLVFQELAAVPGSALRERVGTLATRRTELVAALDLLFTGI